MSLRRLDVRRPGVVSYAEGLELQRTLVAQRVAVIEDAIAIRTKGYLSLGYDHRLIDGAVADEFMSHVKKTLESFDPDAV